MVAEKGAATSVAADGEIPYKLTPNERSNYADLAGKGNAFGTIDYGIDPPWVFVGKQVTLDEIGLGDAKPAQREARRVWRPAMGCPNCGGPLELNRAGQSRARDLPVLQLAARRKSGKSHVSERADADARPHEFVLPIGAEGTFTDDVKLKIIGAVVRSVTIDGIKYFWHEYLLYNPMIGFRWLVHSDNHWNFVEPVNVAEVVPVNRHGSVGQLQRQDIQDFSGCAGGGRIRQGRILLACRAGRNRPGHRLSSRAADALAGDHAERNKLVARNVYMTNAEIEKAFGVSDLPKPWSVAPNQPFTGGFYITWGFALLGLLFVVAVLMIPLTGLDAKRL